MPRYALAFITPKSTLVHALVEMDSREAALRSFFLEHLAGKHYTQDDEGYSYFSEDFNNPDEQQGSLLEV
jgi:hypothetical protein